MTNSNHTVVERAERAFIAKACELTGTDEARAIEDFDPKARGDFRQCLVAAIAAASLPPSTHDDLVDAGDVGSLRYVLNFADTNTRVSTVMKTFTLPDRMTTKDRLERLWAALTKMGEKL
jgi:hypothetical protein